MIPKALQKNKLTLRRSRMLRDISIEKLSRTIRDLRCLDRYFLEWPMKNL